MAFAGPRRYRVAARWYDAVSFERPVYRAGRAAAIGLLRLEPGDRVLDVGCGTGLNFPLLHGAVGRAGRLVGVDASAAMLERASDRIARQGWTNATVLRGDAAGLDTLLPRGCAFDAVLFTYSLSVMDQWVPAWHRALAALRPGGRAAVADLALPVGRWRVLSPLARLACLAGGADPRRHPWNLVRRDLADTAHATLVGGHVHAAAGTLPPGNPAGTGGRDTGRICGARGVPRA